MKAEDRATFQQNQLVAQDEAKWRKITELHGMNLKLAQKLWVPIASLLESKHALAAAEFRWLTSHEEPTLKFTAMEAYTVRVLCAYTKSNQPVGLNHYIFSMLSETRNNLVAVEIPLSKAVFHNAGNPIQYKLRPGIGRALLVRVPFLKVDASRAVCHKTLLRLQTQGKVDDNIALHQSSRKERKCQGCGVVRRQAMDKCGGCNNVYYCSRPCQVQDWTAHKHKCQKESTSKSRDKQSRVTRCTVKSQKGRKRPTQRGMVCQSAHMLQQASLPTAVV